MLGANLPDQIPGGLNLTLTPNSNFRKILVSIKFCIRNSGAGDGCANFMGAWKNFFHSAGKPPCP